MENQIYLIKIGNDEINLKILYEDNHIIVVEKPVNIPSQGDKTGDIDMLAIVKQYIKEKYNKPGNVYLGLVHRLDRPVGGVMVFAKTSKAAARLSEQVREKVFKKNYLVIVNGKFEKNKGTLQDYLLKNEKTNMSKVVKEGTKNSKYAELDYEVLKYDKELNLSVLKIDLHTGRHHQIRVQLSSRQHSIYGDQKYGGRGHGKQICLWAYKLTIQHPISKEEMVFMAVPEKEKSWKILEDLVIELKKEYTIIMVTHNMQQATRISDKTAFFLLGEVVEYDDTEKLFSMPADKRTEDYISGRFG